MKYPNLGLHCPVPEEREAVVFSGKVTSSNHQESWQISTVSPLFLDFLCGSAGKESSCKV